MADASLDLQKGPVEESCKIDIEPSLEAGLPSVEIEDLQSDAPDLGEVDFSTEKPGLDASGPQVNKPEGKLITQVSGPNVHSNIDLNDPSSDLNLPSTKTKRGKCFSCVSSGVKDEPYSKGKVNAGLDLDRTNLDGSIDMKTDGKISAGSGPEEKGLGLRAMGPKVSVPSTSVSGNLSGPSVEGEDFEINPKVPLGGDKASFQPKELGLHASAPDVEIPKSSQQGNIEISGPNVSLPSSHVSAKVPEHSLTLNGDQSINAPHIDTRGEKMKPEISEPNIDVPAGKLQGRKPQFEVPSAELDVPSTKKKRSSCFTCAGDGDRDDAYRKTKGNVGYDFSGTDGSLKMKKADKFDLSRSGPDFEENGKNKEFELRAIGPDFDLSEENRGISSGTSDIAGNTRGPEINPPEVSNEDVDFDVSGPDVSISRTQPVGLHLSGPEVQGSTKGAGLDIDTVKPSVGLDPNTSEFKKKGEIRVETSRPDVDVRSGNIRDPKVNIIGSSADLLPPSRKKPRGNCLSCTGNADKDEPYRAKGSTQFDGPDVNGSLELEKPTTSKYDTASGGKASASDFDIDTPDINISAQQPRSALKSPEFDIKAKGAKAIDVDGPAFSCNKPNLSESSLGKTNEGFDIPSSRRGINAPDIDASFNTPDTGVKSSEFVVPNLGASAEIDARASVNAPDFNTTKGRLQTENSRPDVDVPRGNFRSPDPNLQGPSANLPPSSKRKLRSNCLSCTGGADKDDPYGRAKGNTQFNIGGQNLDGSAEMKKSAIDEPSIDIDGRATGPDIDIDTPNIDASAQTSKSGLKSPEFDFPKARGASATDVDGPAFSYDKPNISEPSLGKTNEGFDIPTSDSGINTLDIDASVNTPDTEVKSPEFVVPKMGASGEIDARSNINAPDFNTTKDKLQTGVSKPNVGVPSGDFSGPDANLQGPSADLPSASKRKLRSNCLSCTGGADKEEPYGRAKGNTQFDFDGPDLDRSVEMKGIGDPEVDIDGGATGQKFDISTPDNDISPKKTENGLISPDVNAPKGKVSRELNIAGLDLSYEKPEVSGLSLEKTEEYRNIRNPEFEINSPDVEQTDKPNIGFSPPGLDVPRTKGARQIGLTGAHVSYEKPNISAPSIGQRGQENDTPRLDLDIDTPQGPEDLVIPKADISVPSRDGDITLTSAPGEDFAFEANLPETEVSNNKREFGLDTNGLHVEIPGVGNNLKVVEPSVSTLHADTSECKPTIGLDMNGLDADHTGDVDFDLSRPQLDVTSKQRSGANMARFDTPDSDYSFPPIGDKEESCEPLEIKDDRGKDFDAKFNLGINTSTPKAPEATKQLIGLPRGEINSEPCPVEADISVVNTYDTLYLHSTPQPVTSAAFDEPHNLQRYDEIRPEMELRLLPPAEVNKSDQSSEFEIPNNSDEKAKNSWKPGSMKLVKVEENVTVCSASVEENESHSPRNRTLTLDREIRRKIEVEFPKQDEQKPSSSSSSSSSSDSDGQSEEKPKRKKKSRLFKAFRKSSTSSVSSKEGRTSLKRKGKEPRSLSSDDEEGKTKQRPIKPDVSPSSREGHAPLKQDNREPKQSSSSSSDDEDVRRIKHPSKDDVFRVETTEQTKTTSASSSSDEEPSSLHGLQKQRSSKNSSSSDNENDDGEKQLFLAQAFEKKELEEPAPSITIVQEDMPAVVSRSVRPVSDFHFAVAKPDGDKKPKERKSSTSSSSDEESKSPMVYKVEYSMYQQQYVVEPKSGPDKPVLSVADIPKDAPEVVLNPAKSADPEVLLMSDIQTKSKGRKDSSSSTSSSDAGDPPTVHLKSVKPISPDLHFSVEKPNDEMKPKERKSSSSCSSDEESKSPVVYEVEDTMLRQQSVLKPESGHEKSALSVADIQDVAPEDVLHSAESKDAEVMFTLDAQTKPNTRKSSASSSSSSDSEKPVNQDLSLLVEKPDDEMKPKEWKNSMGYPSERESISPEVNKVEHTTYQQQYPEESKGETDQPLSSAEEVQEDSPEVGSHSVNPTDPDLVFKPDSQTNLKGRRSSTSSSSSSDAELSSGNRDPETTNAQDPKAMTDTSLPQKYFVSYNIRKPDFPRSTEGQLPPEIKSSTSSSLEDIDDSSHSLDLTVYRYETVHHVIASEFPPTEQEANSSEVQENSFVVVSRSFKRPSPDIWSTTRETQDESQAFLSSPDVQFSEPPSDFTYHLEYPFNHSEVHEDEGAQIQEEGIVPVFKSPSVDHDKSDVLARLESPDEDGAVDQNTHTPHSWNIHAHTFETVYQVTIPDSPATDENSLEIQEMAPTVVTRSVKRTSPVITSEYDNLGVETQVSTSSTEVQFSEPYNDFEIEYPKTGKVLTTDEQDVTLTDEEWIMKHTVERETPDISALLAGFDHPKEEAQLGKDSRDNTEDEEISPREKSPKDIVRRGSSSRLWDLMQGYLIEQPIADDSGANTEYEPEKRAEKEKPDLEITESVSAVESTVPVLNQQTETVHEVTQHASNVVTYKILLGDKEPSKEVTTSITKVERSVTEVTPTDSKFVPVNVQVDVGDKTPVVKEYTTSHWRKQISVPVDVDDDEDPWMRHYSKGLQRATSYQVMSAKSPGSETSVAQSRSLSLSKVPHVKGVKTSTEKERERTRYSIESRARTEPTVYRVTTERRPLLRELEAVPRVRTNENVFSIKDGKTQSPKTQTGTAKEESLRGTSDSGPSTQSLRSFWNK